MELRARVRTIGRLNRYRRLLEAEEQIREQEQQILRAQRMESIGALAGGISHDLNNVLAPILMSIQVLRKTYAGEAMEETLATIETSAKRGANLVRQVLTFARGVQ